MTPKTLDNGQWLALSDDGKRGKAIEPGSAPGDGWHVMTEAEFEEKVDEVADAAVASLIAETASLN